jgi:hypothetical protein
MGGLGVLARPGGALMPSCDEGHSKTIRECTPYLEDTMKATRTMSAGMVGAMTFVLASLVLSMANGNAATAVKGCGNIFCSCPIQIICGGRCQGNFCETRTRPNGGCNCLSGTITCWCED